MAHTEELSYFQHGTIIGCHLSTKTVCKCPVVLELPRSTESAVFVKWKRLGASTAQPRSVRPHKLTEWDHLVLMRTMRKNCLSSVATLTTEFQTASGSNVSRIAVRWKLYEMGFHGPEATHKPNITMRKAKCRLESCKARRHRTLEQWTLSKTRRWGCVWRSLG